ncbi:glycoside hydrolase family 2 protein [Lacticaseibacillus sp. GG6-2]
MIRRFNQHVMRAVTELNGLWGFNQEGKSAYYQLPVPGCWEQHPALNTFRGVGYYRKMIDVPATMKNLRLVFKGVSHTADVYFDDDLITHHYNAYTPFEAVVPEVTPGPHELVVRVDNRFTEASALHLPNDYYTYGGITRTVAVEAVPDTFIERIQFTPRFVSGHWEADVKLVVRNLSAQPQTVSARVTIAAEQIAFQDQTIAAKTTGTLTVTKTFDGIKPWSPESPNLYLASAELLVSDQVVDDLIDRVGFRTVKIQGARLLVNDKPVFLLGFNRHEDSPSFGCAIPFQQMVRDLDLLEDMGANAIRTCHYPNDELFLDLCDERGILVWEENHARGLSVERMQNPNFDRQCAAVNEEMVLNHYNHPGIVIWGILNECASDTEIGRAKYVAQYAQLRALDSTRPLTSATCQHFKDICLDQPDIVSFNMYTGWYQDMPVSVRHEKELDWINTTPGANKPLIISEWGAGAIYGYHNPMRMKWTEERQADIIQDNLDVYLHDERLTGIFLWQFADCRVTDEEWFDRRPRGYNNKGILDEYRRPKMAYATVKKAYREYAQEHVEARR